MIASAIRRHPAYSVEKLGAGSVFGITGGPE
jgi:hypothetical protein